MSNRQTSQQYRLPMGVFAKLYGSVGPLHAEKAGIYARQLSGVTTGTCLVLKPPPPTLDDCRFGTFITRSLKPNACQTLVEVADGALLPHEDGSAVVYAGRDCPIVIMVQELTGDALVLHAGRNQLLCFGTTGIVDAGIRWVSPLPDDRTRVHVRIIGSIGRKHFRHEQNHPLATPFLTRFGEAVVNVREGYTIDLVHAIRLMLEEAGVPSAQIKHDDLCTFEAPWLGSKRAEDAGIPNKNNSNWVVVVRKPWTPP